MTKMTTTKTTTGWLDKLPYLGLGGTVMIDGSERIVRRNTKQLTTIDYVTSIERVQNQSACKAPRSKEEL